MATGKQNKNRRIEFAKKQKGKCMICDKDLGQIHNTKKVNLDHIIPKQIFIYFGFGEHRKYNLCLVHKHCNERKSSIIPTIHYVEKAALLLGYPIHIVLRRYFAFKYVLGTHFLPLHKDKKRIQPRPNYKKRQKS